MDSNGDETARSSDNGSQRRTLCSSSVSQAPDRQYAKAAYWLMDPKSFEVLWYNDLVTVSSKAHSFAMRHLNFARLVQANEFSRTASNRNKHQWKERRERREDRQFARFLLSIKLNFPLARSFIILYNETAAVGALWIICAFRDKAVSHGF